MIDDTTSARLAYTEQVGLQFLQLLGIAASVREPGMRAELTDFAKRLSQR